MTSFWRIVMQSWVFSGSFVCCRFALYKSIFLTGVVGCHGFPYLNPHIKEAFSVFIFNLCPCQQDPRRILAFNYWSCCLWFFIHPHALIFFDCVVCSCGLICGFLLSCFLFKSSCPGLDPFRCSSFGLVLRSQIRRCSYSYGLSSEIRISIPSVG